jgi:hypothetical protein
MPDILAAEEILKTMPPAKLDLEHYVIPGVYCRVLHIPADTAVTGKIHLKQHISILASGELYVADGETSKHIKGPLVMIDKPGIKRFVVTVTDCTFINVLATDKTDIDEIEAECVVDNFDEFEEKMKLLEV